MRAKGQAASRGGAAGLLDRVRGGLGAQHWPAAIGQPLGVHLQHVGQQEHVLGLLARLAFIVGNGALRQTAGIRQRLLTQAALLAYIAEAFGEMFHAVIERFNSITLVELIFR